MLSHLRQLDFGYIHQSIHLKLGPLEILNTERIYSDHLHSTLIANLENLKRLKEHGHVRQSPLTEQ